MAIDMKQASRRLIEETFGKGNLDAYDEICAPDYRSHDPFNGDSTLALEKEICRTYRAAFSDLKPTVLGCWADGEVVTTHWRMTGSHTGALKGIPPSGARCTVEGISVGRYRNGRLAESWVQWDALGLLRQLGVAPTLQATPGARASEQRAT
jgi:predicted ester cyclase